MKKVSERLEKLSSDDKMIGLYNAEIEEEKIKKTMIDNAREEGIEQGIVQRNIEIARNMLNMKFDIETISRTTGLGIKEINNLK